MTILQLVKTLLHKQFLFCYQSYYSILQFCQQEIFPLKWIVFLYLTLGGGEIVKSNVCKWGIFFNKYSFSTIVFYKSLWFLEATIHGGGRFTCLNKGLHTVMNSSASLPFHITEQCFEYRKYMHECFAAEESHQICCETLLLSVMEMVLFLGQGEGTTGQRCTL